MRRLLSGSGPNIREVATESWEICPADITAFPPAIYSEGALDRITALSPWRNWATELHAIKGRHIEHAATHAHLVEDVTISGAYLFCGTARSQEGFGPLSLRQTSTEPFKHIKEASLVSNWAGSNYFGVFMRGSLPLEMLPEEGDAAISLVTKPYTHEADYRAILSLPRPTRVTSAQVDQLILYTDYAHNASKAARYDEMRRRLRQNINATPRNVPGVYLKRGATGEPRLIANETEVEETLTAYGFDIVDLTTLTAWEITQYLLDAPIVVSVEGSHIAHAIYSIAEGGTLLVLQPPNRFAMAFKEFTDRAGLRFAFTVGTLADDDCFNVDIDDLKRTLDLL